MKRVTGTNLKNLENFELNLGLDSKITYHKILHSTSKQSFKSCDIRKGNHRYFRSCICSFLFF